MNDESKIESNVRSAKAQNSSSWVGYRVRLLRELWTERGAVFAAGTELTVLRCFKGLDLVDDGGRRIRRVQKFEVTVVAKKPQSAKKGVGRVETGECGKTARD